MRRRSGALGKFVLETNNTRITSWTSEGTNEQYDVTDTGDYDETTGRTWKAKVPGAIGEEVDVEGSVDLDTFMTYLNAHYVAGLTVTVELWFTPDDRYLIGEFDISNLRKSSPVDNKISFSCHLSSNGVVTYGNP